MLKMNKEKRGSSPVVTDLFTNITAVRWKEAANAVSTFTCKQPIQNVKHYCDPEKRRVNIEQRNTIKQCNMSMWGVDRMDEITSAYMKWTRNEYIRNGVGSFFNLLLM